MKNLLLHCQNTVSTKQHVNSFNYNHTHVMNIKLYIYQSRGTVIWMKCWHFCLDIRIYSTFHALGYTFLSDFFTLKLFDHIKVLWDGVIRWLSIRDECRFCWEGGSLDSAHFRFSIGVWVQYTRIKRIKVEGKLIFTKDVWSSALCLARNGEGPDPLSPITFLLFFFVHQFLFKFFALALKSWIHMLSW